MFAIFCIRLCGRDPKCHPCISCCQKLSPYRTRFKGWRLDCTNHKTGNGGWCLHALKYGRESKKINKHQIKTSYRRQKFSRHVRIVAPKQKGKKWEKHALQRNTQLTVILPHCGTPYSPWTCWRAEHLTYCGSAQPRNTQLTMDLTHHRTPYSEWTCPTAKYPAHCGPAPPGEHPTHIGPAPPRNSLLSVELPHRRSPYSQCT